MSNTIRFIQKICLCFFSLWCLLSCGLEAFQYIDYIPFSDYQDITKSSVWLPSSASEGYSSYFSHFMIFYRIYISGDNPIGIIDDTKRPLINSGLNSDYNYLYPYTDFTSTSVNTSNLENIFSNRKYYRLTLANADINRVLSTSSLGSLLEIDFPPNTGTEPSLSINGASYILQRAEDVSNFVPRPDRRFLNHPDLYNSANAVNPSQSSTNINADAYGRTATDPPSRYTYVSMYIAAIGYDFITTIYSQPTFLGVFQLAEAN